MLWQVQDAKQRFSELLRAVETDGPQIVTRHGRQIAVIIEFGEYRHLTGGATDFKDYLRTGPDFDDLDLTRPVEYPREIDLADQA